MLITDLICAEDNTRMMRAIVGLQVNCDPIFFFLVEGLLIGSYVIHQQTSPCLSLCLTVFKCYFMCFLYAKFSFNTKYSFFFTRKTKTIFHYTLFLYNVCLLPRSIKMPLDEISLFTFSQCINFHVQPKIILFFTSLC